MNHLCKKGTTMGPKLIPVELHALFLPM